MSQVYSSAFVVISGASSGTCGTPFLGPRDEDWHPRQFQPHLPDGRNLPVSARRRHLLKAPLQQGLHEPPFTDAWGQLRRKGPLYKRSWCFQESFLATRVLEYAPGSLIFECLTHRRAEDQLPPCPQMYSDIIGKVDDGEKWRQLVRQYTSRHITFANDKLPAVAGIASMMPQAGRSDYLAGLWSESLLLDLLWHIEPDTKHDRLTFGKQKNNMPVTAPSWSWASLNRAIVWDPLRDFTPLARVLEYRTSPKDDTNPFGQILVGLIHLKCRMKQCKIYWKGAYHRAYYIKPDGTRSKELHFLADGSLVAHQNPESPVAQEAVTRGLKYAMRERIGENRTSEHLDAAVLVLGKTPWGNYNYVGLVVAPSSRFAGTSERLGSIVRLPKEWWSSGEETAVMLC